MDWISDLDSLILTLSGADQYADVLRLLIIVLVALAGVVLFLGIRLMLSLIRFLRRKKIKPRPPIRIRITLEEFTRLRRKLKAALQQELDEAEGTERERISARLAELTSQSANPTAALADMQQSIEEIERLVETVAENIPPEYVAAARAALERVDFSVADQILSEIALQDNQQSDRAALAAFGRGKIAEIEFRWHHAAEHFARAARLKPDHDNLFKASTYLWLNGRGQEAIWFEEDLVAFMRREFGSRDPRTANVLNNHAGSLYAVGQLARAEDIMTDVLRLGGDTIDLQHPDYAAHLETLALIVEAQGRHREAEECYRQALDIDRVTIGETHRDFAVRLGDLATVIEAQGRFDEAEPLYRQVLEIDRATIGKEHPEYAIHLNNLAGVIEAQKRLPEAEELYALALEIIEKALGPDHPNTQVVRRNLDSLRQKKPSVAVQKRMLATF